MATASATVERPGTRERTRPATDTTPKTQPPYAVIVMNDHVHTFSYVIDVLRKVFRYELAKCRDLTKTIHLEGRTTVWSGSKEVAEFKLDLIKGFGPDFYASPKCEAPLGAYIEALPG